MFKDLSGQTFGRLFVSFPAGKGKHRQMYFYCMCECGELSVVSGNNLQKGNTLSCGCLRLERHAGVVTKHGHTVNDKQTPTYTSWESMIKRCTNTHCRTFSYYGGRGITVCDQWRDFKNFLADMGERPNGTTLDRYPDNNGNYEPSNCRWATPKQQANNRRHRTNAAIPESSVNEHTSTVKAAFRGFETHTFHPRLAERP